MIDKRCFLFILCFGMTACSLFDGDTKTPDFTIIAPNQTGREVPRIKIGSTIEVKAELTDDRELATYMIALYRDGDNLNALNEIQGEIPGNQKRYTIDTLFVVPTGLSPSSYEREYSLRIRVEDKRGNSIGKGQLLFLEE